MSNTVHPWRARTRDFAAHLDTLKVPEKQWLRAAERQYLAERNAPGGAYHRASRDYHASMVGVIDEFDREQDSCYF